MTAPAVDDDLDLNPDEVVIGTADGPGLYLAPAGTRLPPPGVDFAPPWASLGFASDDGVTVGGETTSEAITPWQATSPIRQVITEKTRTVGVSLWQLNYLTWGLYLDVDIEEPGEDGVLDVDVPSSGGGRVYAAALAVRDGDQIVRIGWSRTNLDSIGDMSIAKGAPIPLEVTLSALDNGGTMMQLQQYPASYVPAEAAAPAAETDGQVAA